MPIRRTGWRLLAFLATSPASPASCHPGGPSAHQGVARTTARPRTALRPGEGHAAVGWSIAAPAQAVASDIAALVRLRAGSAVQPVAQTTIPRAGRATIFPKWTLPLHEVVVAAPPSLQPRPDLVVTAIRLGWHAHRRAGDGRRGADVTRWSSRWRTWRPSRLERARAPGRTVQAPRPRAGAASSARRCSTPLAHEFKTPLTSVKAAASALAEKLPAGAMEHELATIIGEESDRLEGLVSDATAGASPGVGRLPPAPYTGRTAGPGGTDAVRSHRAAGRADGSRFGRAGPRGSRGRARCSAWRSDNWPTMPSSTRRPAPRLPSGPSRARFRAPSSSGFTIPDPPLRPTTRRECSTAFFRGGAVHVDRRQRDGAGHRPADRARAWRRLSRLETDPTGTAFRTDPAAGGARPMSAGRILVVDDEPAIRPFSRSRRTYAVSTTSPWMSRAPSTRP